MCKVEWEGKELPYIIFRLLPYIDYLLPTWSGIAKNTPRIEKQIVIIYAYNIAIIVSQFWKRKWEENERENGEADGMSFDKRIGVFSFLSVNAYYLLFFLNRLPARRLNAIIIVCERAILHFLIMKCTRICTQFEQCAWVCANENH